MSSLAVENGATSPANLHATTLTDTNKGSSISSIAEKTLSEASYINEKNITTSKWAIASGVVAVAITALAIATLQIEIIIPTLSVAFVLAKICYEGVSRASENRKMAKHANESIALNQQIEQYEAENSQTIDDLNSWKKRTTTAEQSEEVGENNALKDAQTIIDYKNTLINSLPDSIKNTRNLKHQLEWIERTHTDLNDSLSQSKENLDIKRIASITVGVTLLRSILLAFLNELKNTKIANTYCISSAYKELSL